MPGSLAGRVAIVSGASRGVGRTYALALAGAGAAVMALARSAEGDPAAPGTLAELKATAAARGLTIEACGCDVGDEASIVAAVARTVAAFGGVDILVNNAVAAIHRFDALAVPPEEWDATFRVNLRAPYAFLRESVPHMIARGGGAIVNITSGAAGVTRPGMGAHGFPAYAVTKAALQRLTTYFAAEYAAAGIAVNAVSPGNVGYYTRDGAEPDPAYWGGPIVHLAAQRPADGLTGRILHTYEFGRSWGPQPGPARTDAIRDMLRVSGVAAD
jgi:NAD(P)-dependent dehydrogenase (short-subunit alcohol dehydrogenase family)